MVESVVDYEAWKKGYMPPAKRVVASSHALDGVGAGWWLVIEGELFYDEDYEIIEMACHRLKVHAKANVDAARAVGAIAMTLVGDGG